MRHLKINKKGLAPATIGELILVIAGGIIILFIVMSIVGFVSPTASSVGCGLNVRVRAATIGTSGGAVPAPVYMCNQYNTPVEINAANFKACPGIADFCNKIETFPASIRNQIRYECYQQCARIQVDILTDSCWTMAGSGRLTLWSLWDKIAGVVQDVATALKLMWDINVGALKLTPAYAITAKTIGWSIDPIGDIEKDIKALIEKRAAILRCYRFQIINPAIIPGTKQEAQYYDAVLGRSWAYGLNDTHPEECAKYATEDNPFCSYGGEGVKYINEIGDVKFNIAGIEITVPKDEAQAKAGRLLNYNTSAKQICYISYYEYNPDEGGEKLVARSCNSWSDYSASSQYIN